MIGLGLVGRRMMRLCERVEQQVQPAKLGAKGREVPLLPWQGRCHPHLPIHTLIPPEVQWPVAVFHFISNLSQISLSNKNSFSISVQMMKTH